MNALFHAALHRPVDARAAFLAVECADDPALRREIASLLAAHAPGGTLPGASHVSPGVRIGDYEVTEFLAAGAMGEVYRARDTKLGREAALKILPAAFVADPERRGRFEREARLLASLNHPHIATIYGFVEAEGVHALALELVDGETLTERIARGRLQVDEALRIARQIAEALEAAHEQGIIHRDLKPANIKLTRDGMVKVLDFGLAKLALPGDALAAVSPSDTAGLRTGVGMLIGTPAYMSPEQARGEAVDKRTDIWAFGCLLYELVTGTQTFQGTTVADVISAVLQRDPLLSTIPSGIEPLVRRCLEKNPRRRLSHIAEARIQLEDYGTGAARSMTPRARVAVAAALAVSAGLAGWSLLSKPESIAQREVVRFAIVPAATASFSPQSASGHNLAIAPDGSRIVYMANVGRQQMTVRHIAGVQATPLLPPGSGSTPFFSPDSEWVGFTSGLELRKVPIAGGSPTTIARITAPFRGATWGPDNTIVYATEDKASGLLRVSAAGGEPSVVTRPDPGSDEFNHILPFFLPDGRGVLYTVIPTGAGPGGLARRVAVVDLQTGIAKTLFAGSDAQYVDTGHLVYRAVGGASLAVVGFDLERHEVIGEPTVLIDQVMGNSTLGSLEFGVSRNGTLVYATGTALGLAGSPAHVLMWVGRDGREQAIDIPPRNYGVVRISPDGNRAVMDSRDEGRDIWIWSFSASTLTRLTFDPAADDNPLWTPDGTRIVFRSLRNGLVEIVWGRADGSGAISLLPAGPKNVFGNGRIPKGMAPDGRSILINETTEDGDTDLVRVFLDGGGSPVPVIRTPASETNAELSPNGYWMAYQSNESGRHEIYVRPFPDVENGRWQISMEGGTWPAWSRDGRELFYTDGDGYLVAVPVDADRAFRHGRAERLFASRYFNGQGFRAYDVAPNGRRFLMLKDVAGSDSSIAPAPLIVVMHWFEEVKRLVPQK